MKKKRDKTTKIEGNEIKKIFMDEFVKKMKMMK